MNLCVGVAVVEKMVDLARLLQTQGLQNTCERTRASSSGGTTCDNPVYASEVYEGAFLNITGSALRTANYPL